MTAFDVEVFYDGACPMCRREMSMLRRLDRQGRIRFTDIAAPGFDAATVGRTQAQLLARIHARLPDSSLIEGVEVFRRLYAAAGFGPLATLSRLPGIAQALDVAYDAFAQRRLRLGGRCDDASCAVPGRPRAEGPSGS